MEPQNQQQQRQTQVARQPEVQLTPSASNPLGLPSQQEWNQIKEICAAAVKSGMLPTAIRSPEAAAIIALKSRELGIPLMVGFSQIAVINGKPTLSAELIQSLARKNLPGMVFNLIETTPKVCTIEACRPERGSKPLSLSFTIEEANKAELTKKQVWQQYPAAMLRARATTAILRAVCPDALMGISYTSEELGYDSTDGENWKAGAIPTTGTPVAPEVHPEAKPVEQPKAPDPILPPNEVTKDMFNFLYDLASKLGMDKNMINLEIKNRFGVERPSQFKLAQYEQVMADLGKYAQASVVKSEPTAFEKESEQLGSTIHE